MEVLTQTHLRQLRDLLEFRLREIARLDHGGYGDCRDCGEAIALDRLRVHPAASRCAPRQARQEHAQQQLAR